MKPLKKPKLDTLREKALGAISEYLTAAGWKSVENPKDTGFFQMLDPRHGTSHRSDFAFMIETERECEKSFQAWQARQKAKKKAFSLVETLVIIAIVAIIGAIAIPSIRKVTAEARQKTTERLISSIEVAKARYQATHKTEFPRNPEKQWEAIQPYVEANGKKFNSLAELAYNYSVADIIIGGPGQKPIALLTATKPKEQKPTLQSHSSYQGEKSPSNVKTSF